MSSEKRVDAQSSRNGVSERPLIKEIILENFMSYEYARVPISNGLNIICGPNGAGKSSVLLALSVALGQAYTERSRRLSDLIRRGKDISRVTLLIHNTLRSGRRPIPSSKSDLFQLSRFLKKDGTYWFEADFHDISKNEVARLLRGIGINPDNMLLIMHQSMVEELAVLSPQHRLSLVEEAVGFQEYRQNILEAAGRLEKLLSEEQSIDALLSSAEQTLNYWKKEYERLREKIQLLQKRNNLDLELAWVHVIKEEQALQGLMDERNRKHRLLQDLEEKIRKIQISLEAMKKNINDQRMTYRKFFYGLLNEEKELSAHRSVCTFASDVEAKILGYAKELEDILAFQQSPHLDSAEKLKTLSKSLLALANDLNETSKKHSLQLPPLEASISELQTNLAEAEDELSKLQDHFIKESVSEATLQLRYDMVDDQHRKIVKEITAREEELQTLILTASKVGSRVQTSRLINVIQDELRLVATRLALMGDVSEDAETMYRNYEGLYADLKQKSHVVQDNVKHAMKEVEDRKHHWTVVLQRFLGEVDVRYRILLSHIGAEGSVRLVNYETVDTAGLELNVGFRGVRPTVLDAYTQSGGERTTAIMAFLLALQQNVKSPIRAVDEFDIHMDPRNRELITQMLISVIKEHKDVQYLIITPGQLNVVDENVNIITVQNMGGKSAVRLLP